MPFDPTLPQAGTEIDAVQMRSQLNGLKDLIDAVSGVTSAVVDGVNTLNPGDAATVGVSVSGTVLHLEFGIPRGNDGNDGSNGSDGQNGAVGPAGPQGIPGPQGPPFANAVVDGVTTLPPGDPATVATSFDGTLVHFNFGIPQGSEGAPGEVTNAQLSSAIAGTSANTNAVGTLDTPFVNDPPTLADLEVLRLKVNEMILNGRR